MHQKVFLSYASADREFASGLAEELSRLGVQTWSDVSLQSGDEIFQRVQSEISHSDLFVIVVPPWEGVGRNALVEIGAAKAMDKKILAVMPDRSRFANSGFARTLSDFNVLDATALSAAELATRIATSGYGKSGSAAAAG